VAPSGIRRASGMRNSKRSSPLGKSRSRNPLSASRSSPSLSSLDSFSGSRPGRASGGSRADKIRAGSSNPASSLSDLGSRIRSGMNRGKKGGVSRGGGDARSQVERQLKASGLRGGSSFSPAPTRRGGGSVPPRSPEPRAPQGTSPGSGSPALQSESSSSHGYDPNVGVGEQQVNQWISQAEQQMGRDFTAQEEDAIRKVAFYESRFTPGAFNNHDANAAAGQASRGLMQIIPSTYESTGIGGDMMDPVNQIQAAVIYADQRYGGIENSKGLQDLAGASNDGASFGNFGYSWY
jgi:hypothetical protein